MLASPGPNADLSHDLPTREAFQRLASRPTDDEQFEASKILSHTDRIGAWLSGDVPAPVTLELDVTLACNDRCPRCVHGFALGNRHLELRKIAEIVSEASQLGVRGLTLTGGGDPTSHPDFERVVNLVGGAELSAGMFTNGGLIDSKALAREMVAAFEWIRVSVDSGSEVSFRRVRGRRGYEDRLRSLHRLAIARQEVSTSCELGVSFLTWTDVAPDIIPLTGQIKELGFDYVQFKPMIQWSSDSHHLSTIAPQAGVFEAIEEALSLQDDSFRVLLSTKKYASDIENAPRTFSSFHCGWFVLPVALSIRSDRPALYLDCSAKYLNKWLVAEFDSLQEVVMSSARRRSIESTSSEVYCVAGEKHAAYNAHLERLLTLNSRRPLRVDEIAGEAPSSVKHANSL